MQTTYSLIPLVTLYTYVASTEKALLEYLELLLAKQSSYAEHLATDKSDFIYNSLIFADQYGNYKKYGTVTHVMQIIMSQDYQEWVTKPTECRLVISTIPQLELVAPYC